MSIGTLRFRFFLGVFFLFSEKDSYSVQTSASPRRSSGVLASLNTNTVTESSKIPGWGSSDAPWEEYAVNLKSTNLRQSRKNSEEFLDIKLPTTKQTHLY